MGKNYTKFLGGGFINTSTKLKHAKIKLVSDFPFFGFLLLEKPEKEDQNIPVAAVDGESLLINTENIENFTVEEIMGILAHELLHLALAHFARAKKPANLWNIATDLAVNSVLRRLGCKLPEGSLYPEFYGFPNGKSAEFYFSLLSQQEIQESYSGFDIHLNPPKNISEKEVQKKWEEAAAKAASSARQHGKLPGQIEKILMRDIFGSTLDWRCLLKRFISSTIVEGVNWCNPDRRYVPYGIYLPSRREKMIRLAIAIDTSGSISDSELKKFITELNGIFRSYPYDILLIQCDVQIQDVKEIRYPDVLDFEKIEIKGGGGTDFRPVFDFLQQVGERPLVYFTDLEGEFPRHAPRFPVLWVVVGGNCNAPFGSVVNLED